MTHDDIQRSLAELHPASAGWALSCCRWDREEAEEVLQMAYLKILDGRARFGGRSSFRTWLFGVIRRTAAEQRAAIKEQVQKAQAQATDAQFDLQGESQKLVRLLQARPVDEAAALAQVDKVLALERQVKRTQIQLVVRIKNLLTEAQQARLTELRNRE